jgi:hypothetical protein
MAGDGFNVIPPQFEVAANAPRGPFPNSDNQSASLGPHGETAISLYEAPYRLLQKYKQTFFAANQAATTWSVGLTTTYTGFCLNNPIGSKKNLSLLKVGFIFAAAPAAVDPVGIAQGFSSAADCAHTAGLTVYDGQKGLAAAQANGRADAGSTTLSATPVYRQWILGGFTAATLPSSNSPVIDEGGLIELVPGGFIIVASIGALSGMAFAEWAEVDA